MYESINEFIQNELGKTGVSIKNTIIQAYDLGVQHGMGGFLPGKGTLGNLIGPTLEESKEEARRVLLENHEEARSRLAETIIKNSSEEDIEDVDELDSEDDGIG